MPAAPLPRELVEFVRRPHAAVIATLRPDGSPHTAATWYDWVDGLVMLNMDASRVRLGYMRRDPRVALTILDLDDWYRHVSLLGQIVEIRDDPDLADIDRLSLRYRGEPYRDRGRKSVTAMMRPERWHEHR